MLIVSKFHDYYDTASVHGVDKEYVYNRDTKEISVKKKSYRDYWPHHEEYEKIKGQTKITYVVHKKVIGFCGNLYPLIFVGKKSERISPPYTTAESTVSLYSTEEVQEYFTKEKVDLEEKRRYWSFRDFAIKSKKSLDQFFGGSEFKDLKDKFQEHKCPIFEYGRLNNHEEQLILNPRLTKYRFAKIKDPVTAFQDIYMYIAGVLGISNMKMPEFTDKQKAQAKGHDGKYSFRKPPGKRGKSKWR